jgi:hypothetical protein
MNKAKVMKWANLALFISAAVQIGTGLILGLRLFTSKIEFFAELHEHNGYIFVGLLAIHIFLNWGWVRANFFKRA